MKKKSKNQTILESKKDKAVFFDALANQAKPNKELIKAVKDFNKLLARK